MECAACKSVVPNGSKFCIECGAPVPVVCPACQYTNPPRAKFCGNCGEQLSAGASLVRTETSTSPETTASPASPAERRQITVMFCNLVGSTALAAKMDQ